MKYLNKLKLFDSPEFFARFSLFIIFFYFGLLKIINLSPATEIITALQLKILPFIEPSVFLIILGLAECLIGVLFLFPKLTRIATLIFALQIFTTFFPLILLPEYSWSQILVPTLEAQYIIKNLALISIVLFLNRKPSQQVE